MVQADLAHIRLRNHQLTGPGLDGPGDVVRWLGAVQAQEYAVAKWGLARRTPGVTDAVVEQAVADGSILRTHVLRPTWHFVSPPDIRWMLRLTAPRVHAASAHIYRKLELDEVVFRRSASALSKALRDGRYLTRAEIGSVLGRARIAEPAGVRLGYLLMRAELDGLVCSGPRRGKQSTWALLEERVPGTRSLDRDEALVALALRYFTSRGPATARDFGWWSGLAMADVRRGIEMCGRKLLSVSLEGQTYWLGADSPSVTAAPAPPGKRPMARLLPIYDEYPLAHKDRGAAMHPALSRYPNPRPELTFTHPLLLDGRVIGHWRRTVGTDRVEIAPYSRVPLTAAGRRAVAAGARRHGAYLGVSAAMAWSSTGRGQKPRA